MPFRDSSVPASVMTGFLSGGRNNVKLRQIYRGYVRHDVPEASDGSAWLTCPVCQSVCSAVRSASLGQGMNMQIFSLFLSNGAGGGKKKVEKIEK